MSDLKGVLPTDRAVSTFFSWIGKWVVRDSNMSQKDNDRLIEGPGETSPEDRG